jgi:serine/threonine protein phosphatase 1
MNAPPFGARPRPGQPEMPVPEATQESSDEGGGAADSGPRPGPAVVRHPLNRDGRDYVVGDIHGMFAHLEGLLADLEFEPGRDRLFSVGDLVDRGPESHRALEWLARPWFHACRGNHEQFAIDSADPEQHDLWVRYNGGEWWLQLRDSDHGRFRTAFQDLPLAMEVETRSGRVGIIHADVPPLVTWDRFMELLEARDPEASVYALWSRNRLSTTSVNLPVSGAVERVYCGHTPTREVVQVENVFYIDTGAAYAREGYEDARLTLVEIHPTRHRIHEIRTGQPPLPGRGRLSAPGR